MVHILLIEDNPADVLLMKEALAGNETSARLLVVDDGDKAIRFLRCEDPYTSAIRPDLIFLDLNLPRLDGREVLASLKTDAKLKRIPVIVLTTSEAERDIRRAYELYANCYVRKPNDLDEFISVVRACENFWLKTVRLPE